MRFVLRIVGILCVAYALAWAGGPEPAVGLYWQNAGDPTAGGGVCAPMWQLLWRTDNNTVYYKSGAACTAWTAIAGAGAGTVSSVGCGTGLTCSPSPITGTGTVAVTNTAVTAGSYTNASITVNAQGQLTSASSGNTPSISGSPVANQVTYWTSGTAISGQVSVTEGSAGLTVESTNGSATSQPALMSTIRATSTDGDNLCIGGGCQSVVYDGTHSHTGCTEVALGIGALNADTTGADNIAIGTNALNANTTGGLNVAIGNSAMANTTNVGFDTAVGASALANNTTSGDNTAIGESAMGQVGNGSSNAALGVQALQGAASASPSFCVAIGLGANQSITTGAGNVAIGYLAMGNAATTASDDTVVGMGAGSAITTGFYDTLIGNGAGFDITSGSQDVVVGQNTARGITTGNYDTVIGSRITGLAAGLSSEVIIGDGSGNIKQIHDVNGDVGFWGTAQASTNLSSCGTGSPAVTAGSINATGQITEGTTATGCTMAWVGTPSAAPFCVCNATTNITVGCSATTAHLTIVNTSATGDVINYHCFIPSGNF